jgi:hypothetical protein
MKYKTYVSGTIDLTGLPKVNKMEIRNHLESIYTIQEMADIFSENTITIEDEWESFEDTENFMICMFKICPHLKKETSALIMCNGERDGDIWAVIIKANRLYSQRYELKPDGDPKEYEKVKG